MGFFYVILIIFVKYLIKNYSMKRFLIYFLILIGLIQPILSYADEGMWLVNLMEKGLVKNMKAAGLKLPANVIYDETKASLSDAIVALDFACTGSIISNKGLLITNHHCAYADVHDLSTPEHNYLEDGFWAMKNSEEIPIPNKKAYILRKVIDVTAYVTSVEDSLKKIYHHASFRKISFVVEKKYKSDKYSVSLANMWDGEKYYLFYYNVYKDIRLVAAPPVSIGSFGGATDNWSWPQHKGDFAMYRIYMSPDGNPAEYSKNNIPFIPKKFLTISTKGVNEGDFTMVMGYPGRTSRYDSSFEVNFKENVKYPISVRQGGKTLEIMNKWMNKDPNIRLKYADRYFNMSNTQEFHDGEVTECNRYNVINLKQQQEKELAQWINQSPDRIKLYGNLLSDLKEFYSESEASEKQLAYFKSSIINGSYYFMLSVRFNSALKRFLKDGKTADFVFKANDVPDIVKRVNNDLKTIDFRVEKELLNSVVHYYFKHMSRSNWGKQRIALYNKFNGNLDSLADYMYNNSFMKDEKSVKKWMSENHSVNDYNNDPIYAMFQSTSILPLNMEKDKVKLRLGFSKSALSSEYTNAIYEMNKSRGLVQYPDANSTLRMTYGRVGGINPYDAVNLSYTTTVKGILEKSDPDDYEFHLKPDYEKLLQTVPDLNVNFMSNNDITGGNSGSPVMNAYGQLVGLAFDGNKESLSSSEYFHPEYCKCINVDIRYVLWILKDYAHMDYLFDEMHID